jgi:hypothetical protein
MTLEGRRQEPWDEREAAGSALARRGWRAPEHPAR